MKRVIPLIAFGTFALLNGPVFSAPIGAYYQVMQTVYTRDEAGLKYLISVGLNINATNMQGKTALCTAVENQDYEGYELLLSQGATTRTPCMKNMNPQVLARFNAEQPPLGTYYKGAVLTASRNGALAGIGREVASDIAGLPYPHVGEILLAGAAVGTAFAVGVHGSSGGGDDPPAPPFGYSSPFNNDNPAADNYLSPNYFSSPKEDTLPKTKPSDPDKSASEYLLEYAGGTWTKHIDFLKKLNADDAYARGYSGLKVNRDALGAPIGSGWDAISNTKIKVAVMDNGQYYNTDLYNPNQTTTSVKGLNYVYGVKQSSDKPYWTWSGDVATLHNASESKNITMSQTEWNKYSRKFAPVCQGSVTSGCLALDTTYGSGNDHTDENGYNRVYYKVDASDTPSTTGTTFYYIYPEMWTLYSDEDNPYSSDGYTYNKYNAFGSYFETESSQGSETSHGTHVAGIISALRNGVGMQGVAYNAEVIPVKADLGMGQTLNHIPDVINAYSDLRVINLSVGPVDADPNHYTSSDPAKNLTNWNKLGLDVYYNSIKPTTTRDSTVLVFAAGNGDANHKALPQSSLFAAAPLVNSDYKNLLINVVALGSDDRITAYSNRCGATASYCLAAPGGDGNAVSYIFSTGLSPDEESSYTGMAGTSMAAPMVSGSLAVLMGAFPFLTTKQAVEILLNTADYIPATTTEIEAYNALKPTGWETSVYEEKTDSAGRKYNSIYGRGLVDLEAATDPVGLPKISFGTTATSTNSVTATSSSAHISSLASNALKALPENLIVLDDYTRPYQMSTKNFVRSEKRSDSFRRSFRSFMAQDEKEINASDTLSFAFSKAPSDKKNVQTGSMSMMMRPSKNIKMRLAFTQDTLSFGGSYVGRSQQNPFMNMRQAVGTDVGIQFAKNWALIGSWYTGKNGFIDEDIFDKMAHQSRMQLIESGIAYQGIKNVTLGISGGIMDEEDSLFGTRGAGAFKTDGAETRFVRVMANFQPTDKFRLSGAYTYGMTEADKTNTLMQFSKLTSDSFALAAEYMPDEKQTFGIKLVSPLRIRSGSASFNLPVARDLYEDRIYRETYTASLKPTAREYDLSLFYANEISSTLSWAGETGVRLNPDHKKDADTDYRALFKLNWTW